MGASARGGDSEPHNLHGGTRLTGLIALVRVGREAPEEVTRSLRTLEREAQSKQRRRSSPALSGSGRAIVSARATSVVAFNA